jgi:hypothetical protein
MSYLFHCRIEITDKSGEKYVQECKNNVGHPAKLMSERGKVLRADGEGAYTEANENRSGSDVEYRKT